MSTVTFKDLPFATLDAQAMTTVHGGLNAVVNNSQQANQAVAGAFGPIYAVNAPISAPVTNMLESNPTTLVDMNFMSLIGSHQNQLFS